MEVPPTAATIPAHRYQSGFRTRPDWSAALGAFKAALFLLGVIACPLTAYPSIPLDDDELARVCALLERAGLL